MKKVMYITILLLMLSALMSGCVSVPLASPEMDLKTKAMKPPAGKALLYVYRDAVFAGSAVLFEITIDDYPVGKLAEKTYLAVLLAPGKHRINSSRMVPINAEPGKTYYVKTSALPPSTFLVEEEKARRVLDDYKLIYESEDPIDLSSASNRQHQQPAAARPDVIPAAAKNTQPMARSDVDTAIPSTGTPAGRYDIAVVIGNASYASTGTPNVDYALQDAQVMKQYLVKSFGYDPANIIYVENATLTKLNEIFGTSDDYQGKLYKWVKPGQSKIFIYYVGHGAPDQQSGEGYFVPVDANPQYIRTSGYKLSTFYENLSKIPAVQKTVVIDACFSGSSANGQLLKGVSGLTARLKTETKASAADILLTSAGIDQVAGWYPEKGHSLFTYFFLKGVQGAADANKDGHITLGEMKVYLNDQVPYMARRLTGNEQQPVMLGKDSSELTVLTP